MSLSEIDKKLEKVSRKNKGWSNRKSNTRRSTFALQYTHNPATNEICEEMPQMRTELGLVLKHVTRGVEKINVVNYMCTPPPLNDEYYYYEVHSYKVNKHRGVSDRVPKAQLRIIGAKVKEMKVGSMVNITLIVIMSEMEITTTTTT